MDGITSLGLGAEAASPETAILALRKARQAEEQQAAALVGLIEAAAEPAATGRRVNLLV